MKVNIFSARRLKLDVLRSSALMPVPCLVRKLSSQVMIAASCVVLMSGLHKYNKSCLVCSGKNVTYLTSEKHSGNKHRETVTYTLRRGYIYIQGVPGGMDKTSGECSLC